MKSLMALLPLLLCLPLRADDKAASTQVVVVELFASQGCDLCPAAEEYVAKMSRGERGYHDVAPLVYHLDIVDDLGWKDRFASPDHNPVHRACAKAAGLADGYIPMLVVQGEGHTHQQAEVEARLKKARGGAAALRVEARGGIEKGVATLDAVVRGDWKNAEVFAAAFEDGLSTAVTAGKNRGKTLAESGVVRRLCAAVRPDAAGKARFRIELPKDAVAENVGFVVVARDVKTRKVLGAARLRHAQLETAAGAAPAETVKREGDWDVLTLDGGALAKVYVPRGLAKEPRPALVVMLHGWGGDPDGILRFARELADHRRAILCAPRGGKDLDGSGFGWDPESDVSAVAALTRRVIARYGADAKRVSIVGFSAGAAMAAFMCVREKDLFDGCVSCATTEIPAADSGFKDVRAVFFLGDRDPNFSLAPEARRAVKDFEPGFAFRVVKDLGHEPPDPVYLNDALNFLAQRSEKGDEQTLPRAPGRKMAAVRVK
ncbi:MAG: alpha/beta fold hydrolase [Planctomycetes bacterium]|nr:alpha/beta fold hydrolase [Planctomycetota bacterium]